MSIYSTTTSNPAGLAASGKPAFTHDHRPNKQELQACLFHAFIRAGTSEPQELFEKGIAPAPTADSTVLEASSTFTGALLEPFSTAHEAEILYSTSTTQDLFSPLPVPVATPADHAWLKTIPPSPRMLPTPPFSPAMAFAPRIAVSSSMPTFEDAGRPPLATRRSRLPPHLRQHGDCMDPVLTPSYSWNGTFRRTPGAPVEYMPSKSDVNIGGGYFQLPMEFNRAAEPTVFYG
ncbi:hypothetical protein C8Q80DRAFT_232155 [Daedaleopsis nitida]|nr:hypothetical protein C8Q80DRAFT_232155 [Daedaleopsis nitida]